MHLFLGQENIDPLDEVAAANYDFHNYTEEQSTSQGHLNQRQPNHGSIFGQDQHQQQHNATAALLSNAERLSPYREIPNIFTESATQQMTVESVRSDDINSEGIGHSQGQGQSSGSRIRPFAEVFADIPPQQRLFGAGNTESSSHIMFQQPSGNRGGNSQINQGRQPTSIASAPASMNGGMYS